jgi:hypothetical protein
MLAFFSIALYVTVPFPHAQLSVFYVLFAIPVVAVMMDQFAEELWVACVLAFLAVTCLSGIHEVARELENPFRNVPNELPLVTFQAQFNEALIVMYSGYHPDHFWADEAELYISKSEEEEDDVAAPEAKSPETKHCSGAMDAAGLRKMAEKMKQQQLEIEQQKLEVEQQKLETRQQMLEVERQKFQVEQVLARLSEESKIDTANRRHEKSG